MSNLQHSDRIRTVCEFLRENGIPKQYHPLMLAIILTLADDPDGSFRHACRIYAAQNQIPEETVMQSCKRAVSFGWETAASPAALLYAEHMSPEEFIRHAVHALNETQ